MKKASAKRTYRMGRREQQIRESGERILSTVRAGFLSRYLDDVTLDEVAAATGVTVQTLLRRYGSKEGLFTAAAELIHRDFVDHRERVEPGDLAAAVRAIVRGYERNGDSVMRGLYQEDRVAAVRPIVESGRRHHHDWVTRVFGPWLAQRTPRDRTRLHAQLVSVFDVYTWKLFRRDLGLSVADTQAAITELAQGVLGAPPSPTGRR